MTFLLITDITILSPWRQLSSTNSSIWILLFFHLPFLHFMIIYIPYEILLTHVGLISFYQNWWENLKSSQRLRKHGPLARLTSIWTLVQCPWTSDITSLVVGSSEQNGMIYHPSITVRIWDILLKALCRVGSYLKNGMLFLFVFFSFKLF